MVKIACNWWWSRVNLLLEINSGGGNYVRPPLLEVSPEATGIHASHNWATLYYNYIKAYTTHVKDRKPMIYNKGK